MVDGNYTVTILISLGLQSRKQMFQTGNLTEEIGCRLFRSAGGAKGDIKLDYSETSNCRYHNSLRAGRIKKKRWWRALEGRTPLCMSLLGTAIAIRDPVRLSNPVCFVETFGRSRVHFHPLWHCWWLTVDRSPVGISNATGVYSC